MAEDTMLQEAIESLHKGDSGRARDLLTRLLKTDQNNPTYWTWMSATVDSKKERIYCLETALKLDPENATAKRGLLLMGAIPPDDTVPPFPLNHPRLWEEQLAVAAEPRPRGLKGAWASPVGRLLLTLAMGAAAIGLVALVFSLPRLNPSQQAPRSHGTYTATPTYLTTNTPVVRTATPTFMGPTPLWLLLDATYTPTPLYVSATHSPTSKDSYSAGMRAFTQGDYAGAINLMQQVATLEPGSADAFFYIGESYRLMGDYDKALEAFETSVAVNANFGPGYYGRALVRRLLDPEADVLAELTHAIELDPAFLLPFVERAAFLIDNGEPASALADLATAEGLAPGSALVHYQRARAYLALGRNEEALAAAQQANSLDSTMLPVYETLGQAYYVNGQMDEALGTLQVYVLYVPEDVDVMVMLGTIYNEAGDYTLALENFDRLVGLGVKTAEVYYQRGIAHLRLGEYDLAETDFTRSALYGKRDFDFNPELGLAWVEYGRGKYGNAYIQLEQKVRPLADTDERLALVAYWDALSLEGMGKPELARRFWEELLLYPSSAVEDEWLAAALLHLGGTPTPTLTQTPTPTP
ncbi:MAG: tetratricopeptide repeat protein [Chloroflexi bacterium]|nr:tetratricopeptide repeat protein [Chloroflexota bacterium]